MTLGIVALLSCVKHFLFLLCWTISSGLFESSSQLKRFSFPLGNFLLSFLLLNLFFHHSTLLHEFDLLIGNKTLILSIKLFSFLLENFFANGLMLWNAVRIKFPATASSTHHQFWGIVLYDFRSVFTVDLLDSFLFITSTSTSSGIRHSVLFFLVWWLVAIAGFRWLFLSSNVISFSGWWLNRFLVVLSVFLFLSNIFGIVLLHLVVWVLVWRSLVACRLVVVAWVILLERFFVKERILLETGCLWLELDE